MLQFLVPGQLVGNAVTSIIDNAIRDKVKEPAVGSVVYCDLVFGIAEHSGIYIGNSQIVHLNRKGIVERVSPKEFIAGTSAISIYVSCIDGRAVGSAKAAERAIHSERHDYARDYSVILENCHQFSASCVTGEQNSSTFLTFLKDTCERHMGVNTWRVWDREGGQAAEGGNVVSRAALLQLEEGLRKQSAICAEHRKLVNEKLKEYSKHSHNNPALTTFGGLFFESKAASWERKDKELGRELSSLESIMDSEDALWQDIVTKIEQMKRRLAHQQG